MAKKYWIGGATAVAQVDDGSIDSVDATPSNNTFTLTVGGVSVSVAGDTDVATTAAALVAAAEASTHPYFVAIAWTNPSAGNIKATANTPGVPFTATLTETGAGTGTVTDFSNTTASEGPSDWSTPENWSDAVVPVASDDVIIADSAVNISYGLDQNTIDLATLRIDQTYTGKIGLPFNKFATSADGETLTTGYVEYREHYLKIGYSTCDIGQHAGPGDPAGSGRIKLNNDKAGASVTTVHKTSTVAEENGYAAVRLLASNASCDYFIRQARGGVSFGQDDPTETGTIGDVYVDAPDTNTRVFIGSGITLTNYTQSGGNNTLNAAATITAVEVNGGTLRIEGDFTITTLELNNGTVFDNHIKTSGNAITTGNINGGTLDATENTEARTWATINPDGGTIIADDAYVTITTLDQPAGEVTMQVS